MAAEHIESGTGVAESHGSNFPQLVTDTYASQVFWLALTFIFLYVLMARVALPRVAGAIEDRRDKIADDLDKAATLKAEADGALAAYEKALAEARAKAHAIADKTRAELKAETERLRVNLDERLGTQTASAEASVRKAKEDALSRLEPVAVDVAAAIVERLIGTRVDGEAAKRAVAAEMVR